MKKEIKVAIIDLYNNEKNEGMRCLKEIVSEANNPGAPKVSLDVFETRYKGDVPDMGYDIFISSGGPGSPFEGEGSKWERDYFQVLDDVWNHNQSSQEGKKYIFFICHSFQMMNRFFQTAEVTKRHKRSFGIIPFEKTPAGDNDPLMKDLTNPFYAADFRLFQVINPDHKRINEIGAEILSYELKSEVGDHQPALMAMRISNEIAGTQFHPEADPKSMLYHFKQDERKQQVIDNYNESKYYEMLEWLEHPDKIKLTRKTVLPVFLKSAIDELTFVYSD